jgi:hypothetical protein
LAEFRRKNFQILIETGICNQKYFHPFQSIPDTRRKSQRLL